MRRRIVPTYKIIEIKTKEVNWEADNTEDLMKWIYGGVVEAELNSEYGRKVKKDRKLMIKDESGNVVVGNPYIKLGKEVNDET